MRHDAGGGDLRRPGFTLAAGGVVVVSDNGRTASGGDHGRPTGRLLLKRPAAAVLIGRVRTP